MTTENPSEEVIQETVIDETIEAEVKTEVEGEVTVEKTEAEIAEDLEADKKRKAGEKTQKRINKLTREKKEAEAETARLREQLANDNKPQELSPDDYDTQDDYVKAIRADERSKQTTQQQEYQNTQQQGVDVQSIMTSGNEKYADFEVTVRNDELTLTTELINEISESDEAIDMFYHLSKNPVELERISLLDPQSRARELGRLEARLSIPKPRTTNTPAPIVPIDTADAQAPNYENESMADYAIRRNKEGRGG